MNPAGSRKVREGQGEMKLRKQKQRERTGGAVSKVRKCELALNFFLLHSRTSD